MSRCQTPSQNRDETVTRQIRHHVITNLARRHSSVTVSDTVTEL